MGPCNKYINIFFYFVLDGTFGIEHTDRLFWGLEDKLKFNLGMPPILSLWMGPYIFLQNFSISLFLLKNNSKHIFFINLSLLLLFLKFVYKSHIRR